MRILITGGAGFIGSALIRQVTTHTLHKTLNLDKLTAIGSLEGCRYVQDGSCQREHLGAKT